jgi:hypothetical protein
MAWVKAQQAKDYLLAEALYQEILDAKARVFGSDRPDRIASQSDLSAGSGRLLAVLEFHHEILRAKARISGSDCPDKLAAQT